MRRHPIMVFLLVFACSWSASVEAVEQATGVEAAQRLQHKIRMVEFMLSSPGLQERLQSSGDQVANELITRAGDNFEQVHGYFEDAKYLEAEAILDYVLRDLSAAAQLLSADRRRHNSFQEALRQLDSFELPQWRNLTQQQNEWLQAELLAIGEMRAGAELAADQGDYVGAIASLDRAYQRKSQLLDVLPHQKMLVYDLKFESPREEYQYLNQRTSHYHEMVEIALERAVIGIQARKLVDDYIYQSLADLEAAESLAGRERFADANEKLDASIRRLVSVLKILGINI